jgi:hypothetical protein
LRRCFSASATWSRSRVRNYRSIESIELATTVRLKFRIESALIGVFDSDAPGVDHIRDPETGAFVKSVRRETWRIRQKLVSSRKHFQTIPVNIWIGSIRAVDTRRA